MGRELPAVFVDDWSRLSSESVALEELAVIAAGQETRLLALRAMCSGEACALCFGARLRFGLTAEREPHPVEKLRVEAREHVRLVLRRIRSLCEQAPATVPDDAGVVAGCEAGRSGTFGERKQFGESERSVASDARVRRLAASVAADEGGHDRAPELVAKIERHVRQAQAVTRLARCEHGAGGAARALAVGPSRIDPQAQRHTYGVRARAQQRNRAVYAAAHGDSDSVLIRSRAKDRRDRVCERVDGKRRASDRRRLEQGQALQRPLEPRRVRGDDPVPVNSESDERELVAAR